MHYTSPVRIISLPFAFLGQRPTLRASSRAPCHIPLADRRKLTGTSQPTLGVLFFPLSPPSRKGATQEPDIE